MKIIIILLKGHALSLIMIL